MGDVCTRTCPFCNVKKGRPAVPDQEEPERLSQAVKTLGLSYVVITSVTRDDLHDGGASFFADTIASIRTACPGCRIEVLIPDFQGSLAALQTVLDARPDVLAHNIETVPSLYPRVRPQAGYQRSLGILARIKESGIPAKSGLMVGLGENHAEILSVMRELRSVGCSILTLGQYLRPGNGHLPVERYYTPDEFDELRKQTDSFGFSGICAGPLVRSSYLAESLYIHTNAKNEKSTHIKPAGRD